MVQVVSEAEGQRNRRTQLHEGVNFSRVDYLVPDAPITKSLEELPLPERGAQSFIVEQPPGSVVRPHFHVANQFQVILKGSGTLGRHAVAPISVHYAAGYTGYGPITAGEEGLSYFTLRAQFDSGPHHLPEARSEMKDVPRKFLLVDDIALSAPAELNARNDAAVETIIEEDADGLAGYFVRLGPSSTCVPPSSTTSGQFWVIVNGSAAQAGSELPPFSCIFVKPDEAAPALEAGAHGLEALVLQFPRNAEASSTTQP